MAFIFNCWHEGHKEETQCGIAADRASEAVEAYLKRRHTLGNKLTQGLLEMGDHRVVTQRSMDNKKRTFVASPNFYVTFKVKKEVKVS